MKIEIEIPQIRCRKVTHPRTDADEIYVAYMVGIAASDANTTAEGKLTVAGGRVSAIKKGVQKNSRFTPDGGLKAVIDVQDAVGVFVAVAVFEADDGKLHEKLSKDLRGMLDPPEFEWKDLELPTNVKDWAAWLKLAWKVAGRAFAQILRDDHLGRVEIPIVLQTPASEEDWTGLRELTFKRFGGDYRVSVRLDKAQ